MKRNIIFIMLLISCCFSQAQAYDYNQYLQNYQAQHWEIKLNNFITAVQNDLTATNTSMLGYVGALNTSVSALNSAVNNWAITENYSVNISAAHTQVDADTFTVPGDYTGRYVGGRRLLVDLGVDGVVSNVVASSSYGGGVTTVNLNTANLTANLVTTYVVATRDGLWPYGVLPEGGAALEATNGVIATGHIGTAPGNPPGVFRWGSGFEVQGTPQSLMSIFQTANPGVLGSAGGGNESALAFGAYDASGNIKKTASISSIWMDTDANSGHAALRFNATYNGGASDDVQMVLDGGNGINIFPANTTAPGPGPGKVKMLGELYQYHDGTQLSTTNAWRINIINNAAGGKGVWLGYDSSKVAGVIGPQGDSSGISLWTHNGSTFDERLALNPNGSLFLKGAGNALADTKYWLARFHDPTAVKGIILGYDSSAAKSLIISDQASSSLGFCVHNGETWIEALTIDTSRNVGIATNVPSVSSGVGLDMAGTTMRLRQNRTPANASDTGYSGEICFDTNYVYRCVATNTWRRAALSTW